MPGEHFFKRRSCVMSRDNKLMGRYKGMKIEYFTALGTFLQKEEHSLQFRHEMDPGRGRNGVPRPVPPKSLSRLTPSGGTESQKRVRRGRAGVIRAMTTIAEAEAT
ncbi:hypothetical protein GYMLUDRAFT_770635 [Collybiopsis luxurians FD-317 M1]|uniref:Uncharacterized protein n=1 Tax=Collybiopsis luxurians FD-317 M1 TaxID=944289 RepID=A0A0D0CP19_9AGAR|nr:hypothetical protein GYMLUDRAFT_770635 [Collybiopsis luxurians FD-317 M1]